MIRTTDDVKELGTILCIWAHPDDESFTSAGIMAAAIHNGQTVVCITATKGEGGVQDETRWPASDLGNIRAEELQAALKLIGCTNHHWLGYKDGECNQISDEEAIEKIKALIEIYHPDTILTFGPDGLTGHTDHQTVSRWATKAAGSADVYYAVEEQEVYEKYLVKADKQFNFYFNIEQPPVRAAEQCDIALKLTPELRKIKLDALTAMPSQYEKLFNTIPKELLDNIFTIECFVKA